MNKAETHINRRLLLRYLGFLHSASIYNQKMIQYKLPKYIAQYKEDAQSKEFIEGLKELNRRKLGSKRFKRELILLIDRVYPATTETLINDYSDVVITPKVFKKKLNNTVESNVKRKSFYKTLLNFVQRFKEDDLRNKIIKKLTKLQNKDIGKKKATKEIKECLKEWKLQLKQEK